MCVCACLRVCVWRSLLLCFLLDGLWTQCCCCLTTKLFSNGNVGNEHGGGLLCYCWCVASPLPSFLSFLTGEQEESKEESKEESGKQSKQTGKGRESRRTACDGGMQKHFKALLSLLLRGLQTQDQRSFLNSNANFHLFRTRGQQATLIDLCSALSLSVAWW